MYLFRRKAILIAISMIIAAGLSFLQYRYFKSVNESDRKIQVAVAASDIKVGESIENKISLKVIPQSAYTESMYLANDKVSGYAKVDIKAGSFLLKEMVSQSKVPVVEPGMRRVTINVNLTSSLAGRIRPGDEVDIGWIPKEDGATSAGTSAKIIAQKVLVFEVVNKSGEQLPKNEQPKNQYEKEAEVPAAVTLVTTPEQAVEIKECEANGSLFLLGY
nr:MAG: Flp pilus assembly protein CpaB [Bacillota bacterium]